MDFDKTVALYEKAGLMKKWLDTPEANLHKAEQTWYDKVKSKRTGEYWQADDLIKGNLYLRTGNHLTLSLMTKVKKNQ